MDGSRPPRGAAVVAALAAVAVLAVGTVAIGRATVGTSPSGAPSTSAAGGGPGGTVPAPGGASTPGGSLDPVDLGFLQDMIDHHGQALVMATYVARSGDDPAVRNLAWNIVLSQSREVGLLEGFLRGRGAAPGDPTRQVMGWMGAPVPPDRMPGLASQADLAALLNSEGPDLDRRFLSLMAVHHEGGVEMAAYAMDHATDPEVRAIAERIVVSQKGEIADIDQMLGG